MKKFILSITLVVFGVVFLSSCQEENPDRCFEVAEEFWELRDAYDAYVGIWESFTPAQKQETPLTRWLLEDPEQRANNLANFTAQNLAICPRLNNPESMQVYR